MEYLNLAASHSRHIFVCKVFAPKKTAEKLEILFDLGDLRTEELALS